MSPATDGFQAGLAKHNCTPGFPGFQNIAIGGTTAKFWARDLMMVRVKDAARRADHIWITLGGNDALQECPPCAEQGKSANECAAELITARWRRGRTTPSPMMLFLSALASCLPRNGWHGHGHAHV